MNFNFFKQQSPEEKKANELEQYEKQAGKDARKENTVWENITQKGLKKEDVIYADARAEDKIRTKAESDPFYQKWLEEHQNSTLTFRERTTNHYDGSNHPKTWFTMEGLIDGKKVKITGMTEVEHTMNLRIDDDSFAKISGSVDGQPISDLFAKKVLLKYHSVAESRTDAIEVAHEEAQEAEEERRARQKDRADRAADEAAQARRREEEKFLQEEKKRIPGILKNND